MSRPRSRSVYSSEPVQIKATLHPSKRRTSKVTFSSNKHNRKASYTRKRRLSPIEEGQYEDRSSPKSSPKNTVGRKKTKKSFMNSIVSIFKF
jgi:hypothetical protein